MSSNQRFLALDVFRGLTVCLMIIVNTPGDWGAIYAPFMHASWHGLTPTDLVFPWFLFAVGNAMAFVMPRLKQGNSSDFWKKTIKRTVIIFVIGFLLSWFPFYNFYKGSFESLSDARILGVLQRIALCYFFAAVLAYYFSTRFVMIVSGCLLIGYWIVVALYGDANDPYSLAGFVGNTIDLKVLGERHLYTGEGVPFDPEGLLSTLPAIVNVTIGFLVGSYIRTHGTTYEVIAKLLMIGVVLVAIALAWNPLFPVNKKIWTSSFVLVTSGIACVLIGILLYVIEIKKKRRWTYFFEVFGRNPLVIYALSGMLITILYFPISSPSPASWFYHSILLTIFNAKTASFLFSVVYMLLCWSIGYALDKRNIYIKV
jgi:predicted acyltransferase